MAAPDTRSAVRIWVPVCFIALIMLVEVHASPATKPPSTAGIAGNLKAGVVSGGLTNVNVNLSPFLKSYPAYKAMNTKITPGQWYFSSDLSFQSVLKQTDYLKQVIATPKLLDSEFKTYAKFYNKKYSSKTFEAQAKTNFASNLKIIADFNSNPDNKFRLGANQFADLSFDQFKTIMLMPDSNPDKPAVQGSQEPPEAELYNVDGRHHRRELQALPRWFNWTDYGIVTPAKYQGGCGSCWAFAATGAVESAFLQNGKTCPLPDLSEQQIVDCVNYDTQVTTEGLSGFFNFRYTGSKRCSGGWSQDAFDYIYRYYQVPETSYPYTGTNKACNTGAIGGVPGWQRTSSAKNYFELPDSLKRTVNGFKSWIYWYRPMVFYFTADSAFQLYSSGIYYPSSWCNSNNINHAMLAVGWYDGGVGDSYWIIKNSWGSSWGQNGFGRIFMYGDGQGPCKMYNTGFIPTWQFDQKWGLSACSPPPPPPKKPPPPKAPCTSRMISCYIDGIWKTNPNFIKDLLTSPPPPKWSINPGLIDQVINNPIIPVPGPGPNWGDIIGNKPGINIGGLGRRALGVESPAERDARAAADRQAEQEGAVRDALGGALVGAGTAGGGSGEGQLVDAAAEEVQ